LKPVALQLINSFEQGGSERQALQLSRLLHDSGRFDLQVACLSVDGPLKAEIEQLGLAELPSYPLTAFYDFNAFRQLRRCVNYLRALKVDVLHTHDFYTNVFGMFAGALARVPVRIASRRETIGMRSRLQLRLQAFAYSLSHQIVANCQTVRRQLIAEGQCGDKIAVIYNGLDVHQLELAASDNRWTLMGSLNLPPALQNRPIVTMVANMRLEIKDHSMFIRAAHHVLKEIPAAVFLLAGEGELLSRVRAESEAAGIGQSLFFLGRCEKLAQLLAVSDVCVLTSRSEGFSNAILEYMAAGRPVVATDVGGAREAVLEGETGYVVPAGDDQMMAERIVLLLRDPEKARNMGQTGRVFVEENFSCESQLRKTEGLYEKLLGRKGNVLTDGYS